MKKFIRTALAIFITGCLIMAIQAFGGMDALRQVKNCLKCVVAIIFVMTFAIRFCVRVIDKEPSKATEMLRGIRLRED